MVEPQDVQVSAGVTTGRDGYIHSAIFVDGYEVWEGEESWAIATTEALEAATQVARCKIVEMFERLALLE